MLRYLKNYSKKRKEKRYPSSDIPCTTLLIMVGENICREMDELIESMEKRWPNNLNKNIYLYFVNKSGVGDNNYPHYKILTQVEGSLAEYCDDVSGLNTFFRKECNDIVMKGNRIHVIALTCAEDPLAVLCGDIIAIVKNFCLNIANDIQTSVRAFLPVSVQSMIEDGNITNFFKNAMSWRSSCYKTGKIYCRFVDSEPEEVISSNNGLVDGLLIFDARDEYNKDLVENNKRIEMLMNTMEFTDLFNVKESYLQIPAFQPTEVGYEYVLALALEKNKWDVEITSSNEVISFYPEDAMRNATNIFVEDLRDLFDWVSYARLTEKYEKEGKIYSAAKSLEKLEEEYFGNVFSDLYQQWENYLFNQSVPKSLSNLIDSVKTLEEVEALEEKFKKIVNSKIPETRDLRDYHMSEYTMSYMDSPWELRDYVCMVYDQKSDLSRRSLYSIWSKKCLEELSNKRKKILEDIKNLEKFFKTVDDAINQLQSYWHDWTYTGPEMYEVKRENQLVMREKILKSNLNDVFEFAERFIIKTNQEQKKTLEPIYYCRLNVSDLHGGFQPKRRRIESGKATGNTIAFYEPRTTAEIKLLNNLTIKNM